ncbi:hypothetical protein [Egbenema bharatensis]|uniref:hypothetical protein n=1 Tax=Egbenema bharatensis TaxID=3463334 RepID=UPI003A8B71BD
MMRIRHFQGEGYTLTLIRIPKNRRNKGISRSTIEVRDLAGKIFDVWKYEGGEWLNPIHGIAKSVTQVKEIYDSIDIDDYAKTQ